MKIGKGEGGTSDKKTESDMGGEQKKRVEGKVREKHWICQECDAVNPAHQRGCVQCRTPALSEADPWLMYRQIWGEEKDAKNYSRDAMRSYAKAETLKERAASLQDSADATRAWSRGEQEVQDGEEENGEEIGRRSALDRAHADGQKQLWHLRAKD